MADEILYRLSLILMGVSLGLMIGGLLILANLPMSILGGLGLVTVITGYALFFWAGKLN